MENTSSNKENPQEKKTLTKPVEGVSNLHCTCAGNSLLVIKEMGPCCVCPPDKPREHSRLRNQGMTGVMRNTQPRKSCHSVQPARAARPHKAGHAGTFLETAEGLQATPDKDGGIKDGEKL